MENDLFRAEATKWKETKGDGMTGRELEAARAFFQERRNSRQVRRINELLRKRLLARLARAAKDGF